MRLPLRVRAVPPRVLLALLLGLLAVLGTLQYRWSGELSAAERVRMRAGAQERAESFARDLDRELTRLFLHLGLPRGPLGEDEGATVADQVERWRRTAAEPRLLAGVYLAEPDGRLRRLDGRTFVDHEWPAAWTPVRERLSGTPAAAPDREERMGPLGFLPDGTPMLALPVLRTERLSDTVVSVGGGMVTGAIASASGTIFTPAAPADAPRAGTLRLPRMTHFGGLGSLMVVLDLACLREQLLPTLAARHFDGPEGLQYTLSIARTDAPRAAVWQSVPGAAERTPDASAGLLELRPEEADETEVRDLLRPREAVWVGPSGPTARGGGMAWSFSRRLDGPRERGARGARRGRWVLSATHRDGSLDAVVGAARRRNLTVGFGVLGLLGASGALLVVSARRAQRLAQRQIEFVAGVTHELRTPLTVIRSAGENLADGVIEEAAEVRRYGELVRDEGRRLTALVEEALELAGAESGRLAAPREPVPLGRLLEDTLRDWYAHEDARGVRAQTELAADLPAVLGDEAALRRALRNLLDNAVKHGGEGAWVGVRAESHGQEVAVTVEDQGPGIPADEREQVFEPFYRGRDARSRRTRGSGLGLSLVRGIVESHGGRIRIDESRAGGAAFTVTLPALTEGAS